MPNTPSGTLMASSLLPIDVAFLIDACVTPVSKNGYLCFRDYLRRS